MTAKDLPQNRQELVALAKDAAAGIRPALELLKDMAKRAGYEGRRGGWIYMGDQNVARGWSAFADRVALGGHTTTDILAAWLPAGPAVAEVEVENPAQYVVSPARTRADEPQGRFTLEDSLAAVGMTPEVTPEAALKEIGGCWAGGALTGKALEAYAAGDHAAAVVVALAQKALQAEEESAGEILGDVAEARTPEVTPAPSPERELAHSSLAAGVQVAPLPGPCRPTAEDLSGLAVALVAEDLETLDPEEVRAPATHWVVPGDVVRIHRGVRLYEVLKVEEDRARNNLTGEVADMTMARVAPCDPEDQREAQWVHVDLLHVVPPVARFRTQVISHDVAISQDVVMVTGPGWDPERGEARRVALIRVDGTRVLAILRTTVLAKGARPVAVLRIGDALVVDDRCYRVVWHGEPGEPILEPARWRDRLPA